MPGLRRAALLTHWNPSGDPVAEAGCGGGEAVDGERDEPGLPWALPLASCTEVFIFFYSTLFFIYLIVIVESMTGVPFSIPWAPSSPPPTFPLRFHSLFMLPRFWVYFHPPVYLVH